MNKQQTAKKVRAILKSKFQHSYTTRGWKPHSGYFHVVEGFRIIIKYPKKVIVIWDEHHLLPIEMMMNATTPQGKAWATKLKDRYARLANEYYNYLMSNGIICKVEQDTYGLSYVAVY